MKSSTFEIDWLGLPTFVNFLEVNVIDVGDGKLSDHERWKVQLLKLIDIDLQLLWISWRSAWSMLEIESWVTMSDEKFNFWNWLTLTSNFFEFHRGQHDRCWKWKVEWPWAMKSSTFEIGWLWPPTFVNFFEASWNDLRQAERLTSSMIDVGDRKLSYSREWKVQLLRLVDIDLQLFWISSRQVGTTYVRRNDSHLAWSMLEMKSWVTMSDEKFNFWDWLTLTSNFCEFLRGQAERLTSSMIDVGDGKLSYSREWKVQLLRLIDLDLQLLWISWRSTWSMLEMESWVTMSDEKFNFWDWLTWTSNFCEFLRGKLERLTSGGTTHV